MASAIAEAIGFYSLEIHDKPKLNEFNYNIYTLAETGFLGAYFYQILVNRGIKQFVLFISGSLFLINLAQTIQGEYYLDESNAKMYLIIGAYHISLTLTYFVQIIQLNEPDLFKPEFWVCTGLLFFYGGGFLLTGLIDYLVQTDKTLARQVFTLNHLLNIVLYSMIGYAFFAAWKNQKLSSLSLEEQ
ncbi:MAG: hypothetical protein ACK4LB_02550 [Spirosomataceae bacterium]